MAKRTCAHDTSAQECRDNQKAESQAECIYWQAAQTVAKKDSKVGKHSRNMGGTNNGTAIRAHHCILKTTGAGGKINTEDIIMLE